MTTFRINYYNGCSSPIQYEHMAVGIEICMLL